MPKNRTRKQRLSVIEIDESSDSESQSNQNKEKPTTDAADPITLSDGDDNDNENGDDESSTKSSTASYSILTRRKLIEQLPIAARTKSAKKGVASMRLMSMDFVDGKRQGLSPRSQDNITKLTRLESKKKYSIKDEIKKTLAADIEDPELTCLLRKIAYCRVFTNYLFRQYDMLSIDFQLYSNLEDLMIDLKRRVGAYNAIRRSRQQILLGGGVGEASNSSREGSTV